MDEQSSGATESASSVGSAASTPATTSQAQSQTATEGAAQIAQASVTSGGPQAQAYTPNYKFKVFDKEHEFDEWIRPTINKDNEEKIRDLYTKAFGLEPLKQKYEGVKEKLGKIEPEYTKIMSGLNEVNEYLNKGDMDNFFKRLQIPEENVYKWVLNKLNYEQMPPEERAKVDQSRQMEQQLETYQKQNEMLRRQYETQLVSQKQMLLDTSISRPEVKTIADSFDSRMGRPGAFRDEVIKRGILHYQLTGQDLSPEEAIREAMVVIGSPQVSVTTPTAEVVEKPVPVIPNVGSRGGAAPSKKNFRSLDDLKKLANSL
jgi:hypothetical protein